MRKRNPTFSLPNVQLLLRVAIKRQSWVGFFFLVPSFPAFLTPTSQSSSYLTLSANFHNILTEPGAGGEDLRYKNRKICARFNPGRRKKKGEEFPDNRTSSDRPTADRMAEFQPLWQKSALPLKECLPPLWPECFCSGSGRKFSI